MEDAKEIKTHFPIDTKLYLEVTNSVVETKLYKGMIG